MIKDIRYIIKRIIIGVGIAIALFYLKGTTVFAKTSSNVYWYGNAINGQNVNIGTTLWFNSGVSYTWTIDRLGCAFSASDNACAGNNCELFVDFYFSSNMAFSDWSGVNNGYSWSQYNLGNRIMYDNFSTGYFVKRFIFKPNANQETGDNDLVNYYRTGSIVNSGSSVDWGGAFKLQSFKCGLIGDMEQLPNESPQYQQNQTIINNQTTQNQILSNVVNAVNNSSQFIQTLIGRVQNLEDTMKDDSIDESFQGQKINDIQGSGYSNGSISDIILLPVTLINKVVDGLSSNTCNSFNLGSFYGTNIVLPCYTASDVSGWLGSSVYTVVDLLMSFGVIIGIRKLVLKIYNTIVFLKEGGSTID